jgi:hypothetical protein
VQTVAVFFNLICLVEANQSQAKQSQAKQSQSKQSKAKQSKAKQNQARSENLPNSHIFFLDVMYPLYHNS